MKNMSGHSCESRAAWQPEHWEYLKRRHRSKFWKKTKDNWSLCDGLSKYVKYLCHCSLTRLETSQNRWKGTSFYLYFSNFHSILMATFSLTLYFVSRRLFLRSRFRKIVKEIDSLNSKTVLGAHCIPPHLLQIPKDSNMIDWLIMWTGFFNTCQQTEIQNKNKFFIAKINLPITE